jgi:hypothetical protein
MLRTILISALFATAAAGCYSEEPDVAYAGGATYGDGAPGLVEVSPGVDVISDYDYPVFYSDGLYWRYDGGIWYQSGFYNRGWGVAYNVPYGVRGIHNPGGYAHWHGGGYGGIRDHRSYGGGGSIARDHRSYGGYRGGAVHPAYRGGGAVARPSGGGFRGGGSRGGGGGGHGRR